MKLNGIHHITAITGDAQANVDFYVGVLGLRLVKKSVNQDSPSVYHLFFADEQGSAGSDLTFFESRGAPLGRPGAGMVHRISWRVGSEDALDFWGERLEGAGRPVLRAESTSTAAPEAPPARLRFADPEGLEHELVIDESGDPALSGAHREIPAAVALRGFDGVRAFGRPTARSKSVLEETLGFEPAGGAGWKVRGGTRGGFYTCDEPPAERGLPGVGTIHHVAWSSPETEHDSWQRRIANAGLEPTPVIDRHYFKSVYFREPSGVLFEIATSGPGFAVDEPQGRLGETLSLPPFLESRRTEIEAGLTPIMNPRAPVDRQPHAAALVPRLARAARERGARARRPSGPEGPPGRRCEQDLALRADCAGEDFVRLGALVRPPRQIRSACSSG